MTMGNLGLRERKKLRTRETIARVALELFDKQGYAETTITQIAAAADVSPRTVSGYFPAKEDLAFPETEETFAQLAARLDQRPPGEMAPEALRAWLKERMAEWKDKREILRAQHRVIASNEALQAHNQLFIARAQELLGAAIAVDIGAAPDDLEPRMAAASTTAILDLLGDYIEPKSDRATSARELEEVEAEVLALLDRAVVFVSAGIRALRDYKHD